MERRLKRFPDRLYFETMLPLLARLPPRWGYRLVRALGDRVAGNFPEHRQLLIEQLRRNLPESSPQSRTPSSIADEFYRILTAEDLDAFHYERWNAGNIRQVFTFEGLEHLDAQRDRGQGAVLVSGHVGSICAAVVALGVLGYPLTHLAREYPEESTLPTPFLRYALKKVALMERKLGRPLIYAGAPENPEERARTVLTARRTLKQGGFVSMAIDVPPFRVPHVGEANFLGRRRRFPVNFVQIAADCKVPMIPFYTWRDPQRCWRQVLVVHRPVPASDEAAAGLQACVSTLESAVVQHPENWFAWDSIDHFGGD